ncbi:MAG: Nif3-like dinuclear metal center hexameric protein, partial [Bacteroidales bacterium]
MKVKDIIDCIEKLAPSEFQESYDNSGLIIGDAESKVYKALICIDVTERVIEEAIKNKCNLIVSHHPLIFNRINKITNDSSTGRSIIKAVQHNISVYAAHTNLDNVLGGINSIFCKKIGLINTKILTPRKGILKKLVTFCPVNKADTVRKALFDSGAGHIGNYDSCSYNINGNGTFRALENANPYVGKKGRLHVENEIRIETIFPGYLEKDILKALFKSHPYEEVAYDVYPLDNEFMKAGAGMIGELSKPLDVNDFLKRIKKIVGCSSIRYSELINLQVKKVAVCGGAGSFLIKDAISAGADIFITSDLKYHQFYEVEGRIIIADIGHYESEQIAKEILVDLLSKNFPTFAILVSREDKNPVHY